MQCMLQQTAAATLKRCTYEVYNTNWYYTQRAATVACTAGDTPDESTRRPLGIPGFVSSPRIRIDTQLSC